jgi:putative salt-induced outer membrane protein YdiY
MRLTATVWVILILGSACSSVADEVIFKNGDRLTGTIVRLADGQLTIDSWSAGEVTVETAKVRTISTEGPIKIHFRDGTVVTQPVSPSDEGRFAIEREGVLEPQVFAIADVVAINPPEKPKAKWTGNVTAGMTLTRSNTDTENASLSAHLVRKGEVDRITFDAALLYGRREDPDTGERITTEDLRVVEAQYDYFLSQRLFAYANSRIEKDSILDLDLRLIAGAGLGREWVQRDDFSFRTEGGLAWLREDFADETEANEQVTARMAYHIAKRFNDRIELSHELAWYPALEDIGDYFLNTEVNVRVSLTDVLFTDFKVIFDYDSTPARDADNKSLKSILGLGLGF